MAFLKLLSSIVFFTVKLVGAEKMEERYEDLVHSSMQSVVALNEVVSGLVGQISQISTSLFEVKLALQETQEYVRWLEQDIVDLKADTLSVIDEEVADLTTLIAGTSARIDDMEVESNEREIKIISGEQPAGDETCTKVCAGSTGRSTTDWKYHSSSGIYEVVDISDCGFTTIPTITTSIEGNTYNHYTARGTSSIYKATTTSFTIYVKHESWTGKAEEYEWNVEWIAVGYTC